MVLERKLLTSISSFLRIEDWDLSPEIPKSRAPSPAQLPSHRPSGFGVVAHDDAAPACQPQPPFVFQVRHSKPSETDLFSRLKHPFKLRVTCEATFGFQSCVKSLGKPPQLKYIASQILRGLRASPSFPNYASRILFRVSTRLHLPGRLVASLPCRHDGDLPHIVHACE